MSPRPFRSGALALATSAALAACGFAPSGETPATVDGGVDDDGDVTVTLRDDTLADFTVAGTASPDLVIEPWGALAPAAFHAGGLVAHGVNTQRFTDPSTATWAGVTAGTPAGTGLYTRPFTGDPIGVGLDSGDTWTLWAEGEVYLDAGTTVFLVDADDAAFLEIAVPGEDFARVANATQGLDDGEFVAGEAGWYPIRLAVVEGVASTRFDVQLYINGSLTPEPLAGPRLRSRVGSLRGAFLSGWDNSLFQGTPERTLTTGSLVDADFGNSTPLSLGMTAADYWSLRWATQFYVTTAGMYRLRVESDDGHRLYVDDALISDALVGGPADRSVDIELAGGWTDLVLDVNENTGNARARLGVLSSPEPGLDGALPASRLRPLEPRGERLETKGDGIDRGIPDNDPAGVETKVEINGLPGATVDSVDVMVALNHSRIADLQIRLVHPSGDEVLLRTNSTDGGNGNRSLRFNVATFDDTPAAGAWGLRVTDTAQGNSGTLLDFQVAVHMANGPDQVARTASFTSLVRDLGAGVIAIDTVHLGARIPAGTTIQVRLRSCDAPELCATTAWSPAITDGGTPAMAPARYIQYQLELTSDGSRAPELDSFALDYRIPAP